MEYIKGNPYYALSKQKIKQYKYLTKNIKTDILIIGGGINGAILNYYLSKKYNVTLVDKSRFGFACTSCATPLCEYQLDEFASELLSTMSEQEIIDVYNMGLSSIKKIDAFIKKHGNNCSFTKNPALVYTEKLSGIKPIEKEYDFRIKHGFQAKLFDENNNPFPFKFKAGLYCENGGCAFNAYLFTKQLIENSENQKNLYEHTKIDKLESDASGYKAYTNYGNVITAKKIIVATGFNWELLGKSDICERYVTYTIVTKPIENLKWYKNALCEDDQDPYHYFRILPDNRIIYGGEDNPFNEKEIDYKKAEKLYEKLECDLKKLLQNNNFNIEIEYKFCGAFGSTTNNLGVIGESDHPDIYYFFSCGANGIINAMFGADLIDDLMCGKENKLASLFTINRKVF